MSPKIKFIIASSVSVVLLGLVAYLGVGWFLYNQLSTVPYNQGGPGKDNTPTRFIINNPRFATIDTTPYLMPQYEVVRFPSRQAEISLAGWYVEADPAAPAVIITHGLTSCKCTDTMLFAAGLLHHAGFNVLLFDLREHGESDRVDGRTALGNDEYLDVLGAWDWLVTVKGFPPEKVGLLGYSLGAGTTLIAFGNEPRVAAAWADSPYYDLYVIIQEELARQNYPTWFAPGGIGVARWFGGQDLLAHSPQEALLRDNGRPLFITQGEADLQINIHHLADFEALAQQSQANLTTWRVPNSDHHEAIYRVTDDYTQRLITFFSQALGK